MRELSNAQHQYLRRLANQLKPVIQIGKNGLSSQALSAIDNALETHELIKVKFLDFQDQKHELADDLASTTGSVLVGLVGNIATLYRRQSDPDRRKIELPG